MIFAMYTARWAWDFVRSDLLGSVVRFPLWWYHDGGLAMWRWFLESLLRRAEQFGLRVWMKNLLIPMYGVQDWEGRLVSLVMRTLVLCAGSVWLVIEGVITAGIVLAYFLLPIVCVVQLFRVGMLPFLESV